MQAKYSKVYDALVERIADMNPGERLDSEVKLASSFNVSPMTVRRALMLLSQKGLTVGVPGRGTFVADPAATLQRGASEPPHITDGVSTGAEPNTYTKLVSAALEAASDSDRDVLQIGEADFVARIRREHYLDEEHQQLVGVEIAVIKADAFPGILGLDLSQNLGKLLQEHRGRLRKPLTVSRTIRSMTATPSEAKQLHVPESSALLVIRSSFIGVRESVVAVITTTFLGEQIELKF